ncbi:MAG: hypothetical protein GF392_00950 [Candidatus Omnitrophica bacterium]|nr:hypothetical protein [Candidatus Omnitrophota bacterium]
MPGWLKHENRFDLWLPAVLWAALILILSVLPSTGMTGLTAGNSDKIAHFFGYMIFSILFLRAVPLTAGASSRRVLLFALILTFSYGILMELLQCLIPGRDASLMDILFNFGGAALGTMLGKVILWRK